MQPEEIKQKVMAKEVRLKRNSKATKKILPACRGRMDEYIHKETISILEQNMGTKRT